MNRSLDPTLFVLLIATAVLALIVAVKDSSMLGMALQKSGRLFLGIWPEFLLGFMLAGLVDVLVPEAVLTKWLGEQHLGYGILAGWILGLLLPGGPYLLFPLVANLMRQGAAPGPLIALLTAKVLLSPIRMVSYEAPLLGWPMTLARFVPSLLLPPIIALAGHWLFHLFHK
jgi:uncharacterized membrane protein YraQ (UPF0718 family)